MPQVAEVTFPNTYADPVPKFFETSSRSESFSNLKIWLLFMLRLRLPSMQPKFSNVLLKKWHL